MSRHPSRAFVAIFGLAGLGSHYRRNFLPPSLKIESSHLSQHPRTNLQLRTLSARDPDG